MAGKRGRRIWALIGLITVFGLIALLSWLGPVAMALYKGGFFEQEVKSEYVATSKENLRRLQTALMLYHDSEGRFPEAGGWMDAIENRLQTNDLKPGEGAKKLDRPGVAGGKYGYALNTAVSGKYLDDLPNKANTILVFETSEPKRNAHGSPTKLTASKDPDKNLAIRVDGSLVGDSGPAKSSPKN